ncbi:hypothetical protein [Lacticaseibacillus rhamnosus]|uniref:hypothetical protein n=1 Tax=Lacticaseibacillus rhamnosus TaxID=47715 RepID=UPI0008A2072D|nr:hypothetical protein [Lacticaseibacillus rhamnosus]MDK7182423.1 hypothetical protein [Lacticaseibacillus rhamnosus]MDK7240386.1 hypothetical protein [Lacticaseibacillus rhamnosus]MDT8863556.1 hypothetical protein [Lacticaseibacillus rhamnosus]OFN10314.1 hypothetical protein HMPREF2621_02155 [Lactobacillus sp. HMSC072E07]
MITEELYKFCQFRNIPKDSKSHGLHGSKASIKKAGNIRFKQAERELFLAKSHSKSHNFLNETIRYTNEFLKKMGNEIVSDPKFEVSRGAIRPSNKNVKIDYCKIKRANKLFNEGHIIWMKFTKDGYLGVVAAGTDINFSENTTSGQIIRHVDQEWDENFVLIFPLSRISDGLRKDIECGVGNYLIQKGVPILDYYSHRFQ